MESFSVLAGNCAPPSIVSPRTLKSRPSTPSPTGTWTGAPVFFTFTSRRSPSVESSAIARTRPRPRCCATSSVIFRFSSFSPTHSTRRACSTSGILCSKYTSTTGPTICLIVPVFIIFLLNFLFVDNAISSPLSPQ